MKSNQLINVNERIQKWKALSDIIPTTLCRATSKKNCDDDSKNSDNDPFNCSDLIVPQTHELVKNVLKEHVEEWRELDSRLIVTEPTVIGNFGRRRKPPPPPQLKKAENNEGKQSDHNEENLTEGEYTTSYNWGRNPNHIKLPDFFDYTCKGEPPQPPPSPPPENCGQSYPRRRKVVSLEDPTKHLDYECELWKIFKEVPLATDIEREAVEGHACVETMKIRNEIEEGHKEYTRMDAHALSRLRKRERHHWPRVNIPFRKRHRGGEQEGWSGLGDICGATIRVECWRRQLKRGSGCDPNRCEVELLESNTLLDLHNIIVTCSQDDLFTYGRKREIRAERQNNCDETSQEVMKDIRQIEFNGYFFIEDTFYTHGDVDYVTPIIEWLDEEITQDAKKAAQQEKNKVKKRKKAPSVLRSRREYLGIKRDVDLKIVSMKDMKLGDLSFRLACRYLHVFNGDCESAIMFSDISMRMSNENVKESQYPLVHDIFTTTTCVSTIQESHICQVCERGSANVMTLNDEMTDGGPTLFCPICYAKLHYNKDGTKLLYNNFEVVPLNVLQNLRDLCVGNDTTDALF